MSFIKPSFVATAQRIEDVSSVIEAAEQAALNGSYAVVILSYEASPAFDAALKTHPSSSIPLACVAVFETPSEFQVGEPSTYVAGPWEPRVSRCQYDSAVGEIQELIRNGSTYQVNYSFPLVSSFVGSSFDWYLDLCQAQDADYCAYLDLGRYKVLSLSPELFFQKAGSKVQTRPMKGTARRGRWTDEDRAYERGLADSAKDKAENVMIVDLLRNDLGKVSIPGSVHVSSLFELERFETLWQMTSTVESTLQPGTTLLQLVSALFPCGSITGAPKIRTMQIIRDLEPHPRGVYTGTIGLLRPGGDCTFNVAIRTIVLDSESDQATFGVGGGITIDSTADREYEECLVKSTFLRHRPIEFNLFESMLLEQGKYFLFDRHMKRLSQSADYFSFASVEEQIRDSLMDLAIRHADGTWKIKVELQKDGQFEIGSIQISTGRLIRRVALASKAIDSSNRFLFHKTTQRDFYSSEIEQRPDCDDIIFFNERGEITESSIANVVVRINDKMCTPSIQAGLLAGTFRNALLAEGKIVERTISIDDLRGAKELFLINSVRKWMRAELAIDEHEPLGNEVSTTSR